MPVAKGRGKQIALRQLAGNKPAIIGYGEGETDEAIIQGGIPIVLGQSVTAGTIGYMGSDGLGYAASNLSINTAAEFIFVTTGTTGETVTAIQDGLVYYQLVLPVAFTIGSPIYLATGGGVTQTEPSSNIWQYLGVAVTGDTFLAEIDQPIVL